jgi:hypothetical protein
MTSKLTKKKLLEEMDDVLQRLNLLRSALEGDPARKQDDLQKYKKLLNEIMNKKK